MIINLLIADDHAVVRSGIQQILATTTDLVVAAEAANGTEVLAKVKDTDFDLVLLDMAMPGVNGVDLISRIKTKRPRLPVLVFSMHNEGQVVSRAVKAGADGYLTKGCEPELLIQAVRKVAAGGHFIDPALVDAVVFDAPDAEVPPHELLSEREFQVLELLAAGHSLNGIAEHLHLSAKTVSTHKSRLMQKLGLANNAELVRYAIRHGLSPE